METHGVRRLFELVRHTAGAERRFRPPYKSEYERLRGELQAKHDASRLPELPSDETSSAVNDLLVRIRLPKY